MAARHDDVAMLITLAQACRREVSFVDTNDHLAVDDRVDAELAAEINPDVNWWRMEPDVGKPARPGGVETYDP